MNKLLMALVACAFSIAAAYIIVSRQMTSRHAAEIEKQQDAWQAERTALEAALDEARNRPPVVTPLQPNAPASVVAVTKQTSAGEIIARLRAVKLPPGAAQARTLRLIIHDFEELVIAGPSALPAIREFLNSKEDVQFNTSPDGKGFTQMPLMMLVPLSLRIGLLDVAKQIGGADAEAILAETLSTTARATEVAWLAKALQEMAPNKYRDVALVAARGVLERAPAADARGNERDLAFGVLTLFGDASYTSTAQAQVLRADGQVDRAALKYLLQSLGPQAVPLMAQLYDDPRITNPESKEPFARVALNFVGADAQANEFYVKAINDMNLSKGHRKNLIEDLNQDGFVDRKNLSARDLPLIDNRIALIEQLVPNATDPVNLAAMKEAYKDLVNMRERATQPPKAP